MKHAFEILQPIVFVGGKGGVGKTTLSSTLAVFLGRQGKKTLLVSTDPAHSLSDIFSKKIGNKIKRIEANLFALELNPHEITKQHFKKIESTLREYSKPEMFSKIQDYLRFSFESPGAEEAAMLESVCNILVDRQDFEHIVFDTAPTGHTLRLLSLPSYMSAWTDGLLTRQKEQEKLRQAAFVFWDKKQDSLSNPLKPNQNIRLQKAQSVLEKRKKLFQDARSILTNKEQTAIVFVTLAQDLPVEETKRALATLKKFGLGCSALFVNQVIDAPKNHQQKNYSNDYLKSQKRNLLKIQKTFKKIPQFYFSLTDSNLRGSDSLHDFAQKHEAY